MRLGFVNTSVQETYMIHRLKGLSRQDAWNEVEWKLRGTVPDNIKILAEVVYADKVGNFTELSNLYKNLQTALKYNMVR